MRRLAVVVLLVGGCTVSSEDGTDPLGPPDPPTGGGGNSVSAMIMGDGESAARIVIAKSGDLCADARANPAIDRKLATITSIDLVDVSGSTIAAPSAPGSYTIYPNTGSRPAKSASFVVATLDASCEPDAEAGGQSGTVVLTSIAGGKYKGTYDVTLNSGDHVTGSFDPAACPELAAAAMTVGEHSCQ